MEEQKGEIEMYNLKEGKRKENEIVEKRSRRNSRGSGGGKLD